MIRFAIIFSGWGIDLILCADIGKAFEWLLFPLVEDLPHQFFPDSRKQVKHVQFRRDRD